MKNNITKYLVFSLSLLSIVVLISILISLNRSIDTITASSIEQTRTEVFTDLSFMIEPTFRTIETEIEHGKSGFFDNMRREQFDLYFIPIIKNSKLISSIELACSDGEEKKLIQNDSTWINRHTCSVQNNTIIEGFEWRYINNKLNLLRTWKENTDSNQKDKSWIIEASLINDKINSTKPYLLEGTNKPGITFSEMWINGVNNKKYYFGFDLLLTDISNYIASIKLSTNGKVFIITEDKLIIGLTGSSNQIEVSNQSNTLKHIDEINNPILSEAYSNWELNNNTENCFPFSYQDSKWWGSILNYYVGSNTFKIGIIAPEDDYLLSIKKSKKYIISGLIFIMIFALVFIRVFIQIKKQKDILFDQKVKIEENNKEIVSSIEYAKRIQTAILPTQNELSKHLKNSFVLYKPKDIVAGDFYWLHEVLDKDKNLTNSVLFAAADCTGHGVPGAIVHMLCSNALNSSVNEYGLTNPADILNKTREIVIHEFEKSDYEVKDGMDIALCLLNGNKLTFSGANNPLWIIRDGQIIETKADKQPVGKYISPKSFSYHETTLEDNDLLYIFSDGYADQFGGEKDKKFGNKRFKEMLLKIHTQPLEKQKLILNDTIEQWRGNSDQVDDIIVIGFCYK